METQQGFTLWLTGMSGAGKSTLANYLAKRLPLVGRRVEVLDMSELEEILPEDPDSSREVRDRNVRQLGWMARVLTRNGITPIVAAVSPYREVREEQRREIGRFFEVFVDCSFEVLMERDSKGIYRKALSGELQDVVGVQSPYEPPTSAEVKVDMGRGALEEVAKEIFDRMVNHGYLSRKERDILVNGSAPSRAAKAKREAKIDAIREAVKKAKKARAATASEGAAAPKPASKPGPKSGGKPAAPAAAKGSKAASATAAPATAKAAGAKAGGKAAKTTPSKSAPVKAAAPKAAKAAAASKAAASKTSKAAAKPSASKAPTAKVSKPAPAKAAKMAPAKGKGAAPRKGK